jgi:hypothetical protein
MNETAAPREEPTPSYFEFTPNPVETPAGKYTNPQLGEVVPGRIYEMRAHQVSVFAGHPDWKKSTPKAFSAQEEE